MTNPLISADELAELLASGDAVTVLDVRWRLAGPAAAADYADGHIRGAAFVDLDTHLSAPPGKRGRHPLPASAAFEAGMRCLGVSATSPVVCYDFADATSAARAWWLLRYFGHADVRVLDGGYAAWTASGRPTTRDRPDPQPGDFVADPGHLPLLGADEARQRAKDGVLLDAREWQRYTGRSEPVDPVAGHIPGARSAPTNGNVDDTGRFLSAEALRARFEEVGVEDGRHLGVYCGSGVTAAQEVLALELAGFCAALYADSWSGWITDRSRPVVTGERPGCDPNSTGASHLSG